MDTSEYLSLFIEESIENIHNLNDILLQLENNPEDQAKVNEIFRIAHTLKGMSATMGFNTMAELTHKMEDVLSLFRDGKLKITEKVVTILFTCVDTMEKMINNISEGKSDELAIEEIVKNLSLVSENKNVENEKSVTIKENSTSNTKTNVDFNQYDLNVIKQAIEVGFQVMNIEIYLSEKTLLKSARAFLIFKTLEEYGEIIKSEPSTEDLENENFGFKISILLISKETKEKIYHDLENLSEVDKVTLELLSLDKINKPETITEKVKKEIQESLPTKDIVNAKETNQKKKSQSVRVEIERLDNFMNMVSELVINRTRLELLSKKTGNTEINETIEQIGRITSELQELILKIRMLPLEVVFSRFPRMVRDLAVDLGKDIEFIVEGQDIEIDRTVIDEIGEPLVHLIRNAVDHGIEKKEDRIAKGKNAQGKVKLSAHQEGTKVVIRVEEDGAGIDVNKVKSKAEKNGIDTRNMSESEIQNLIFAQGFSTKEQVTDVSGRGVGLDVVKTKINSFGGTVEIKSELGKGSCFIISLPLTLEIIQTLLVKIGGETLAVSLNYIDRVIEFNPEKIIRTNNIEVIKYNDKIIPFIRTYNKLGLAEDDSKKKYIMIVKLGEKVVGLKVDSLIGQQEIVIKPLGKTLGKMKEYIGATILGDGLVTLILDISALV